MFRLSIFQNNIHNYIGQKFNSYYIHNFKTKVQNQAYAFVLQIYL